jgi:hypothetical protein
MKRNLFLDTEFYCGGDILELISIAIVSDTGDEFYAENKDFNPSGFSENMAFIKKYVMPKLMPPEKRLAPQDIRQNLHLWLRQFNEYRIWAYYGAYDWVVFCKIFGGLLKVPNNCPMRFWELDDIVTSRPAQDPETKHHALADAKWNRAVWSLRNE